VREEDGSVNIDIDAIVASMVSRQPLCGQAEASQSHVLWLSREVRKLMVRHLDLTRREGIVSRREEALRVRGNV
jgi:hypothetical protein